MRKAISILLVVLGPWMLWAKDEQLKIEELKDKAKQVNSQYFQVKKRLKIMDQKANEMNTVMSKQKIDIESQKQKISYYEMLINDYERSSQYHIERLKSMWLGLYKGAYFDMLDVYFTHEELGGYLDAIIEQDRRELEEYAKIRSRIVAVNQDLNLANSALKKNLMELEAKKHSLYNEREKKNVLLASLSRESKTYQAQLQRLLRTIQKQPGGVEKGGMVHLKGLLPWPVKGDIVRDFGPFDADGIAQISQGVDIVAEDGTPVKSIYQGRVVFTDWIDTYGYTIIIDHGGGIYSIYGHVQKYFKNPGQDVSAEEVIALVGCSGVIISPALHFEIRLHDKPQNPLEWILQE
ncbi:MAG: peptidoglycan DD-metalloendopeptidase family protein [Deltaproteobacteria bacterium]|nr:peptidoglycan DD-metalloendopeptidase family protein [Deltaproteobacteria bacterium]